MNVRKAIGIRAAIMAATLLLPAAVAGCAARSEIATRTDWTSAPLLEHLVGLASGAPTEPAARAVAMQDVVRQIAEMVATAIRVDRVILRTGDAVDVRELVRSEARALVGTPWNRVTRQEIEPHRLGRHERPTVWDARIEVGFTRADLDLLIREARDRSTAFLEEFNALLTRSETEQETGNLVAALSAASQAIALAESGARPVGLDLETPARGRLSAALGSVRLRHEGTAIENCRYAVRARITDVHDRPMPSLNVTSALAGSGTVASSVVATDRNGLATFRVLPHGPGPMTLVLRVDPGFATPPETLPAVRIALEPPARWLPPEFQVELRADWRSSRWLPLAPRLRALTAVLAFPLGVTPLAGVDIVALAQGRVTGDSHVREAAQAVALPTRPRPDGTYVVALPELAAEIDRWHPRFAFADRPTVWITFDMQGHWGCGWARWQVRRDAPLSPPGS